MGGRVESLPHSGNAGRKTGAALLEAPGGELVFVPAEVVAEFVEVGQAGFVAENSDVVLGVVPEIVDVEENVGGRGVVVSEFLAVGAASEEAEDVCGESFGEDVGGGRAFVVDGHSAGERTDCGRELALGGPDDSGGDRGEFGVGHGRSSEETSRRSKGSPVGYLRVTS